MRLRFVNLISTLHLLHVAPTNAKTNKPKSVFNSIKVNFIFCFIFERLNATRKASYK